MCWCADEFEDLKMDVQVFTITVNCPLSTVNRPLSTLNKKTPVKAPGNN